MNLDRQHSRLAVALAAMLAAASLGVACATATDLPADVKAILLERCTSCHSVTLTKYWRAPNRAAAESMLDAMVTKGAALPAQERAVLLDFFVR